jgi:GNAT superfamily N-acetyltransferase
MSTRIVIRNAIEQDALAMAELSATLGYDANADVIASRLHALVDSQADLVIVASDPELGGTVVGWLQAHAAHIVESGFRVEITGLVVSPEHRRHGAGRALVSKAERWARTISAEAVVVRSNVSRVESHLFYPALGYTATKTQTVYRKKMMTEHGPAPE